MPFMMLGDTASSPTSRPNDMIDTVGSGVFMIQIGLVVIFCCLLIANAVEQGVAPGHYGPVIDGRRMCY